MMLVMVRTLPRAADQKIVYQDASSGQPLSDILLPGQITDLYKTAGSLSADQLKAAIDSHVPAGYRIVEGYQYPAAVQLSDNMPQLLVAVRKITTPDKPIDPPTPPDPDKPTDPTKPTDPEEPTKPTDPVTPVEPVEPVEPSQPKQPVVPTDQAKASQPKASRQMAASLPQTGNQPFAASILSLGFSALLVALGFSSKKKRN